MIQYYCDRCNTEMTDEDHQRLKVTEGRFYLEIMTAVDNVFNEGELCHDCIRDMVKATDKREHT